MPIFMKVRTRENDKGQERKVTSEKSTGSNNRIKTLRKKF